MIASIESAPVEQWLPVVGFEGRYEVSDSGRIKSLARTETFSRILNNGVRGDVTRTKREKILVQSLGSNGYLTVRLCGQTRSIHHLVLEAFVGSRPTGFAGCHGDGNRTNNRRSNLRWDSYAANNAERFVHMADRRRKAWAAERAAAGERVPETVGADDEDDDGMPF